MPVAQHQQFNVGAKAIVVGPAGVLVLLAFGEQFWELPGGKINKNEDIKPALSRELSEELPGSQVILIEDLIHAQLGQMPLPSQHLMLLYYRVTLELPVQVSLSDEHRAYRWINPLELADLPMWRPDKQALQKFFTRIS